MILRPYQNDAVSQIHDALNEVRSAVYTLPTGGGKTPIFADISRLCSEYGSRALILEHRDTLITQATEKLREFGVSYSVIAPGHRNFGDAIQVASVQTLVRRLDRYDAPDLIIVDEAHHAVAGSYRKILDYWPDARILGVTATPMRMDGRGLNEVFERLIVGPSIRQLIDYGYLTTPVTYAAKRLVDLSKAKTTGGDYNLGDLQAIMDRNEITGDAVAHYTELCPGVPAIAFCVTIRHAEDTAEQFRQAGYKATAVSGKMPLSIIRDRINGLRTGEYNVLTSCDLISEGVDIPGVTAAILLRPTRSMLVYLQQVGRALRPVYAPGPLDTVEERMAAIAASAKPRAIILDHAGNCFRHGLADAHREWALVVPKRKSFDSNAVKQCPNCFAAYEPKLTACPICGYEDVSHVVDRDSAGREANQVDGDLTVVEEFQREESKGVKRYRTLVQRAKDKGYKSGWAWFRWAEEYGSEALYDDVLAIGRINGYSPGWAIHKFNELQLDNASQVGYNEG